MLFASFLRSWINHLESELILWIETACIVCLAAITYAIRMKCGCESYFIRISTVLRAGKLLISYFNALPPKKVLTIKQCRMRMVLPYKKESNHIWEYK